MIDGANPYMSSGGFAAVFLAHDTQTQRQLACKVQDLAMLKRSSISTRQLRQEIAVGLPLLLFSLEIYNGSLFDVPTHSFSRRSRM